MATRDESGGRGAADRDLSAAEDDRSITTADAAATPKIGVARLVGISWLMFLRHIDVFVMLMWRPFAVSVAAAFAAVHLAPDAGVRPMAMGFTLVSMIAVVPVITAWHRMILLGADDPEAGVAYRLGRTEWSYLKAAALLYGLGYVAGLVVTEIYGPLLGGPILYLVDRGYDPWGLLSAWAPAAVKWLSVALIIGFLVARFFLVLPARAVGHRMSYGDSAIATRGNGLRLVAAYVLASVPTSALAAMFDTPAAVLASARTPDQMFLDLILAILPRILLYTIAVGILSLAYERLAPVPRQILR